MKEFLESWFSQYLGRSTSHLTYLRSAIDNEFLSCRPYRYYLMYVYIFITSVSSLIPVTVLWHFLASFLNFVDYANVICSRVVSLCILSIWANQSLICCLYVRIVMLTFLRNRHQRHLFKIDIQTQSFARCQSWESIMAGYQEDCFLQSF